MSPFGSTGEAAAISHWWFRNEPPNAAWKKLSAIAYFGMVVRVEVLVDRQRLRVVDAHRQADRVAAGDVAVLLAAIELVLLVVEAMDDVTRATARGRAGHGSPVAGLIPGSRRPLGKLNACSVGGHVIAVEGM